MDPATITASEARRIADAVDPLAEAQGELDFLERKIVENAARKQYSASVITSASHTFVADVMRQRGFTVTTKPAEAFTNKVLLTVLWHDAKEPTHAN